MKNRISKFLFFLLILIFIRNDFRFNEINYGSYVDDAEYYYHTVTIAVDYDLDYSNQMIGVGEVRQLNYDNNKLVPIHPFGTGLLAAPFVFVSNLVSKYFENINSIVSFNYYVYSFIPIIYLLISITLISKVIETELKLSVKNKIILIFLGSGVVYFAFERFSMSHIYEMFATTWLIFISTKKNKFYQFFLPLLTFILLMIRWSNFFYFLIPYIVKKLLNNKNKLFNFNYLYGFLSGLIIFLIQSKFFYGIYSINPLKVFNKLNSNEQVFENYFSIEFIQANLKHIINSIIKIIFSFEFGLIYISPIIFIGIISIFYFLINKNLKVLGIVNLFLILLPFSFHYFFQGPGYSFGYRYFYSLVPIFILYYFKYFYKNRIISYYLYLACIFSILSYLFFETTTFTSLSNEPVINSFGVESKYVNSTYVLGVFKSIIKLNSYLHIIFTSALGLILLKIIGNFINLSSFISKYIQLNDDIENLLYISDEISYIYLLFPIFFAFMFIKMYFDMSKNEK